jgi:hypothetical protein
MLPTPTVQCTSLDLDALPLALAVPGVVVPKAEELAHHPRRRDLVVIRG